MRVITLNDGEALINYAKPNVNELRANMVRVDADFSATPFKAKMARCRAFRKFPASARRRLRLVIGGRDVEAGAVSVRLHQGGARGAKSNEFSSGGIDLRFFCCLRKVIRES